MDDAVTIPDPSTFVVGPAARARLSHEEVAEVLRRRIMLGGFEADWKLPTERELAAVLEVSRNTVRQAVRVLAAEGMVETRHGRSGGTRVIGGRMEVGPDRDVLVASFRKALAVHMEYRRLVEPPAAALAAERADPAALQAMSDALAMPSGDLASYHRADTMLHLSIAAATGNPVLAEAIADARAKMFADTNVLWFAIDWHRAYDSEDLPGGAMQRDHASMVAAIGRADADAAFSAMLTHLHESEAQFNRIIDGLTVSDTVPPRRWLETDHRSEWCVVGSAQRFSAEGAAVRDVRGEVFTGCEGYLDTASTGIATSGGAATVLDAVERWTTGRLYPADFDEPTAIARAAFGRLIGFPVERVAMLGTVSTCIGLIAAAIPDGARVAVLPGEFTSVTFPFAAQAVRGVQVIEVPAGELEARAGEFDVVAAAVVQSADGAVLDLETLRARRGDALVVLDVTQAAGWMNLDLVWADAVVGASYKWLLAPRGTSWMALSNRLADSMIPHAANWAAAEEPWNGIYGMPLRLTSAARRFDASATWFAVAGAAESLPWLADLDMAAVEKHVVGLAARVRTRLGLPEQASPIVSISTPGRDLAAELRAAGLRAAARAGATRVSLHLYNTDDDVDRLLAVLDR